MTKNCKDMSINEVIHFFSVEIDGMGKLDGHPRNEGVPSSISLCSQWSFCELDEDEFFRLTIPDNEKLLIREKIEKEFDSDLKQFIEEKLKLLESGEELPPLIIRTMFPTENQNSSYYIEDGAHRAITLGVYFKNNPYKPVKCYVGWR